MPPNSSSRSRPGVDQRPRIVAAGRRAREHERCGRAEAALARVRDEPGVAERLPVDVATPEDDGRLSMPRDRGQVSRGGIGIGSVRPRVGAGRAARPQGPQVAEGRDAGRLTPVQHELPVAPPAGVETALQGVPGSGRLVAPGLGIDVVGPGVEEPRALLGEAVGDPEPAVRPVPEQLP